MASLIKVNTIKDLGGNTVLTSNGSGTISGLPASAISSGTVATARLGSGTASSSTFLAGDSSYKTVSGTTINNNADNKVITGSGTANTLEAETNLTYNGTILGVGGTGDLGSGVHIKTADSGGSVENWADELVIEGGGAGTGMSFLSNNDQSQSINFGDAQDSNAGMIQYSHYANNLMMHSGGAERMRIASTGSLGVGQTGDDGSALTGGGDLGTIVNGGNASKRPAFCFKGDGMVINRSEGDNNSRDMVMFYRNGSNAGSISASNSTVTYGTFLGVHYAQLTDDSKPDILVGTVLESIDKTCEWHQAKFTIPATEDREERIRKEYVEKTNNVGDVITYNFEDTDYLATIIKENDEEYLARVKVSDTEDSKAVYGVFQSWMESEANDISVGSLGAFMIRVHKDETVSIGDYLQSKGDGTAKVQADDILRASTIAKVVKTNKIKTYDDGSYLVSCTLHCG